MKKTIIISLSALSLAATAYAGNHGSHAKKNMNPEIQKEATTVKNNMINTKTKTKISSEMDTAKKPYAKNKSQIKVGKTSTTLSNSPNNMMGKNRVKGVQKSLKKNGYNVSVDGHFGQKTKSAIMKFQEDNNLKATGKLDSQTKTALMGNSKDSSNQDY